MSSIAKATKRSKKTRRLGPAQVLRPEEYESFDVEARVECIRALIPLGRLHVQALLKEEVCTLLILFAHQPTTYSRLAVDK